MDQLNESVNELQEYVRCFFNGTKTPRQAWEFYDREHTQLRKELLAAPDTLVTYMESSPHYVVAAILGRVKINPTSASKKLAGDYKSTTAEELRASQSIAAAPEVRPLLDAITAAGHLPKILAIYVRADRKLKLPEHP